MTKQNVQPKKSQRDAVSTLITSRATHTHTPTQKQTHTHTEDGSGMLCEGKAMESDLWSQ